MTESAISLREQKRWETSQRITACAQQLTVEHGLDGFTMETLADVAEVSRRTLFNYFPSKTDAVLGTAPEIPADVVDTFRAGGPTGNLMDDLAALARAAIAVKNPDRASVTRARQALAAEPRLLAAAHQRFETITIEFTDLVLEREGAAFGARQARLLLRLMVAIFDDCLLDLVDDDDDRTLGDHFDEQLAFARALLG